MDLKILKEKNAPAFNPKNYKNSPFVRDFYRFIAKNGLRSEAHKMFETSRTMRDKTSYLSKITVSANH
jgi:hypothetical protein